MDVLDPLGGLLMDKDAYLLELSRYVVLNPVRAGMVDTPAQWLWSSYWAMMGQVPVPKWLAMDGLLSQFGAERERARQHYQQFVSDGVGQGIWDGLHQQIYLGDEAFVERMQAKAKIDGDALTVLIHAVAAHNVVGALPVEHDPRTVVLVRGVVENVTV